MKEKTIKTLIIVLVVVLMAAPIIIDKVFGSIPKSIEYKELDATIANTQNYGFALVYVAPGSDESIRDKKKDVKKVMNEIVDESTKKPLTAYYLDYENLSASEIKAIFGNEDEEIAYMFIVNGEILNTIKGEITMQELENYAKYDSGNNFNPNLTNYKVPADASEYKKLIKRKNDVTMTVFGRDTCFYCNKFKVVYNRVAVEKNLDIYYINSDSFDDDEYDKIMKMGLKIPASCSSTGKEVELQPGFGTPLTLFTKNGKVIDCINGYTNKANLITKLETVGMLKAN